MEAQSSTTEKEIIAWLAPIAYSVDYYVDDLANARTLRHPKTCSWIFSKDEFNRIGYGAADDHFLWIYAQPGAGKTILSSYLIDHFSSGNQSSPKHVLYFFCKNADGDKNTSVAISRSLLYQLHRALRDEGCPSSLNQDISGAVESSGQQRATSLASVWEVFVKHIQHLSSAMLVIDALDECLDPEGLATKLQSLAHLGQITVIVTSRKEARLYRLLGSSQTFEITEKDVNADIRVFVEDKVASSPRLSLPVVREVILRKLCDSHGGMFMWAYLMLKELKSCVSVLQVQEELKQLPNGLDGIYQNILQRLQDTLDKHALDLCSKVLTWVVTALVGSCSKLASQVEP